MPIELGEPVQPSPKRDYDTAHLLIYYFKKLCEADNITAGKQLQVLPEYLFASLREKWGGILMPLPEIATDADRYEHTKAISAYEVERDRVCELLDASHDAFRYLTQMAYSPGGVTQVLPVWPSILLHDRPMPKNRLRSMHYVFLLEWEDGRMMPYSFFLPCETAVHFGGPADGLNDATLANQLYKYTRHCIQDLVTKGIDHFHSQSSQDYGGEHPFDVLMGMMMFIIEANKCVRDGKKIDINMFAKEFGITAETVKRFGPNVPQLAPDLLEHLEGYMRLCQGMIRPPKPPELKAEIARVRALRRGKEDKPKFGGWDG